MMTKEMLEMMTVKELRNYVKDNNLKIAKVYKLKKSELIEAITTAEICAKEEECLNHEDDCTGFSPDMFTEATDLENSRTDYGTSDNGWESIAKEQITHAYNWLVGENENTMQDTEEDSDEYKAAYNLLHDTENLINYIYREALALNTKYDVGFCGGKAPKEMRFAGKEFCRNVIIDLLKRDGYYHEEKSDEEILDETVAEAVSNKSADEIIFERTKENSKPIVKKVGRSMRYICPCCGKEMKNKDNYCNHCGLQLNHNSLRYDEINSSEMFNNSNKPKKNVNIVYKYGKKVKYCPSCGERIWSDNYKFCMKCGQEIEGNA